MRNMQVESQSTQVLQRACQEAAWTRDGQIAPATKTELTKQFQADRVSLPLGLLGRFCFWQQRRGE